MFYKQWYKTNVTKSITMLPIIK